MYNRSVEINGKDGFVNFVYFYIPIKGVKFP